MDWREQYERRTVTADEAVAAIKSGDRVVVGHAAGEPTVLMDALVKNADQYTDVEIVHMVPMHDSGYVKPEMEKHFRHNALFAGGTTRKPIAEGRADYTPVFFSKIPQMFRESMTVDVALVQVSPPDAHGYCSFGISVDYTKPAAESARTVIAQVNPQMPRTLGDTAIHVSDIDYFVEVDIPLIELPSVTIGPVEAAIGAHCASLINDGDTLQLGIGAIPDAVLSCLKDKKDLGLHSEMLSDGLVALIEAGVITNKHKTINRGKSIGTFVMGTRALYDYVDNNPSVMIAPVDYVNDPVVISQNDNLISVNSCIQVDLAGQVVSTTVGLNQISGVGGQVDFVRGAGMSKGGKTIMAMPSTAKKGTVSKVVALIDEGAAVTTSREDVDYIVTEFGIAQLRGKSLRQRAREMIAIAHPDFRAELAEEYRKRFHEEWLAPSASVATLLDTKE